MDPKPNADTDNENEPMRAPRFSNLRRLLKLIWVIVTAWWAVLFFLPWVFNSVFGGAFYLAFAWQVLLPIPLVLAVLFAFVVLIAEEFPPRST